MPKNHIEVSIDLCKAGITYPLSIIVSKVSGFHESHKISSIPVLPRFML